MISLKLLHAIGETKTINLRINDRSNRPKPDRVRMLRPVIVPGRRIAQEPPTAELTAFEKGFVRDQLNLTVITFEWRSQ